MAHSEDTDDVHLPARGNTQGYVAAHDLIAGVYYPRTKLSIGEDGEASDLSPANPMPITADLPNTALNLFQVLSVNGDGTGDFNIDTDFSVTPDDYYIQPGPSENLRIRIISIAMTQTGADSMSLIGYGGDDDVLTNGMQIIQSINGVETPILNIASNMVLASIGLPVTGSGGRGGGAATFLTGRIILTEGLRLNGSNPTPDRLIVRVNDDHTQFNNEVHTVFVTGAKE